MADISSPLLSHDPEAELLFHPSNSAQRDLAGSHSIRTTPVFTSEALAAIGPDVIPQRAVYGSVLSSSEGDLSGEAGLAQSSKLYVNTNAPFSAVVCGLQVRLKPLLYRPLGFT